MSGVKKEKPRLKYAVELSRHIQGFGLYLTLAILCNLMFKLLPLATSLVTSYMVSSVLLGEASQVIRLLAACGVLVILLSLFSYLDVQVSHDMAYRILTKLRDQCYAKLDELAPAALIPALWLMPVFVLSSAIFTPILDALSMSTNYGLIFGAAQRVLGLFAEKPLVRDEGKRRLDMRGTAVEVRFEDVRFTYPTAKGGEPNPPVLNGLSFSFRTGETVALVGASGGGKSTAARLLQRFWDVDGGRISINGTDVRELTLENLRDIVTVVPQEVYLFNMSVAENLRLARLSATDAEIREAARRARAEEFIEKLPKGYVTVIGERGLRLSGGEKQRLSIAQAFLKNAPVLVLDEASANLDAENERLINQAVEHLKQGRATLVIAHRISTIRAADRIVMVENGRVAGEGTYAQLMEGCPEFRKLMGDEYAGTEN